MCFLSVSPSPPEFHTNHRRISLQAPRSHQLPSATFCHTLSEGRYFEYAVSTEGLPACLSDLTKSGKQLTSPDPDVHTYIHDNLSLFLCGIFASLSLSCI